MSQATPSSTAPAQASGQIALTAPAASKPVNSMRLYLDRAVRVLERFGLSTKDDSGEELIRLLEDVKHVDEAKALAIADVIKHMSTFNRLVRENVENIKIGNRYVAIAEMFDSVREDSKMLISQLADGKISRSEKFQNWWMRIRRGTPSDRFEEIAETYKDVSKDTKDQLVREGAIMDAYIDFRFALKEAEVLACELYEQQTPDLEAASHWQALRRPSTVSRAAIPLNADDWSWLAMSPGRSIRRKTAPISCSRISPRIWPSVMMSVRR